MAKRFWKPGFLTTLQTRKGSGGGDDASRPSSAKDLNGAYAAKTRKKLSSRALGCMVAGAMMLTTAIVPVFAEPETAMADTGTPGICSPQDVSMGENIDLSKEDTGVATFVGRDLYIGGRPSSTTTLDSGNAPGGTYTVEVEGLTLVNGKLAMNPIGTSWDGHGVRFGAVGFGAMFRPATGSTALVVRGQQSNIGTISLNGIDTGNVGAWARGGFLGGTNSDNIWYKASIAGNETKWNSNSNRSALVAKYSDWATSSNITWNAENNGDPFASVNGTDYTNFLENNLRKDSKNLLRSTPVNGNADTTVNVNGRTVTLTTVTESAGYVDPATMTEAGIYVTKGANETISRTKYTNDGTPAFTRTYTDSYNERLITFVGDDKSAMQVFNIDAKYFSDGLSGVYSSQYGISFAFKGIPANASVAVNIVNAPDSGIEYHNGWRFYWDGTDIANGYGNPKLSEYDTASKSVMWNYADTSWLKVLGGMNGNGDDDSATATLGSIMVPYGDFESHTTTNGRVYVGGDLMLYSPTAAISNNIGSTASMIWMDQERHNYPWSGSFRSDCAVIEWNKTDMSGNRLGGTTWGLYGSLEEATKDYADRTAILEITDDDYASGDIYSDVAGYIGVQNLNPNATYYIREIATNNNDYTVNSNVYQIVVGDAGDSPFTVGNVYDSKGDEITNDDDKKLVQTQAKDEDGNLLFNADGSKLMVTAIGNEAAGGTVSWGKTSTEDLELEEGAADTRNPEGLAGSEWLLTKVVEYETDDDGNTKYDEGGNPVVASPEQKWKVEDVVYNVGDFYIQDDTATRVTDLETLSGSFSDVAEGSSYVLTAVAEGKTAQDVVPQEFTWESSDTQAITIVTSNKGASATVKINHYPTDGNPVIVTVTGPDERQIALEFTILQSTVTSLTVSDGDTEISSHFLSEFDLPSTTTGSVTVGLNATKTLTSEVVADNGSPTPVWSSDDESIVRVNATTGQMTGVSEGTTKVRAVANNASVEVNVTVEDLNKVTIYIAKSFAESKLGYTVNLYWIGSSGATTTSMTLGCSNSYYYATVNNAGAAFDFVFNNGSGTWLNYNDVSGSNFTANAGERFIVVTSASSYAAQSSAPSGCSTSAYATQRSAARVTSSGNSAGASVPSTEGLEVYEDKNGAAGKIKLVGLAAGTYTLQETKAPSGYFINLTVYSFTVSADGTVDWVDGKSPELVNGYYWIGDEPIEVSWEKVDADNGNANLAGSTWTIVHTPKYGTGSTSVTVKDCIETGDDAVNCPTEESTGWYWDMNTTAGKFTLKGLPVGTYHLTEDTAPNNYVASTDIWTFTIDSTSSTPVVITKVTGDNSLVAQEESVLKVPNTPKTGEASWTKVDASEISKLLAGSEWSLDFYAHTVQDDGTVAKATASTTYKVYDCVGDGSTSTNCSLMDADVKNDVDTAEGKFKLSDLGWGTYVLTETKAPEGYNKTDEAFTVVIGPAVGSLATADGAVFAASFGTDGLIGNEPGVVLPATGSGFTMTWLMIAGTVIVVMALMGTALMVRRES